MRTGLAKMKGGAVLLAVWAACTAGAAPERIGDWAVSFPAEAMRGLSTSERTCVNRALGMNDAKQHRAAVAEWRRFETEFVSTASETALAWAAFFQAYSLDRSNNRYQAIQLYGDTIELYPDSTAACAALFFRGAAQSANGNAKRALEDYRALVDTEAFRTHPLAYEAHRRLGWAAFKAGRVDEAIAAWRAVAELKKERNRAVWEAVSRDLALLEALANPEGALAARLSAAGSAAAKRLAAARSLRDELWGAASGGQALFRGFVEHTPEGKKSYDAARQKFLLRTIDLFEKKFRPVYEEAGALWEFNLARYDMYSLVRKKDLEKLVASIVADLDKAGDPAARSSRAIALIGRLKANGRAKDAKLLLAQIVDPVRRAWTAVELGWALRDGAFVVESLKPLEDSPDGVEAAKAKREHARACQSLLSDYDAAIRLYEEAPAPPATLWAVADCHRSAGRKPRAQQVLDEICSIFPSDASNAMLRKGDWYRDDGDVKRAIGCYRRILAHAEWKKTAAASQAHQRLEVYGIGTGGAVLNEVH